MREPCWMRDTWPAPPYRTAWHALRHWWQHRHTDPDWTPLDD